VLSSKQQEYLNLCTHRWNLKIGATGSGKSWLDYAVVIPKRLMAMQGQGAAVMLGHTQGTLSRNILDPMREIWGDSLVGTIRSGDNTVELFGRRVYALGADKKSSVARIQGMTIEYAYGDEMGTWNQELFEMLKSRLRCAHSAFDGTANPAGPQHFVKKFIDSDADVYCQTSTIDDNPFLPAEFVAQLKKEYAGTVYYNRFILGQWAAAEGVIYRSFADSIAAGDGRFLWPAQRELRLCKVVIGVDFGGNGSKHAFVATGFLPLGQGVVALASQRLEPGDVTQLVKQLTTFLRSILGRWRRIDTIYCDSAEQVIIRQIRADLSRNGLGYLAERVFGSKKIEITERIRLTSILMGGSRFFYLPEAATLRDALSEVLWSDKYQGKDVRLDDGSTDIDSLDAFEYTIERDRAALLGGF
jgi:PBSX family phage terminase large subunit